MNITEELYEQIKTLLLKEGVKKIAIFGSYARGEPRPDSDIDLLVEFAERKSLLDLARIQRIISEKVGRNIDLLTEKSISPYLVDRIKQEMKIIYK